MNEPSVLDTLARRYAAGDIYTRTGPGIIIAINPFARLPALYGPAAMEGYRLDGAAADGPPAKPPHIFSVASHAYWRMREEGKGQSLLVRGPRGLWGVGLGGVSRAADPISEGRRRLAAAGRAAAAAAMRRPCKGR
jgi:hypothetical protein